MPKNGELYSLPLCPERVIKSSSARCKIHLCRRASHFITGGLKYNTDGANEQEKGEYYTTTVRVRIPAQEGTSYNESLCKHSQLLV